MKKKPFRNLCLSVCYTIIVSLLFISSKAAVAETDLRALCEEAVPMCEPQNYDLTECELFSCQLRQVERRQCDYLRRGDPLSRLLGARGTDEYTKCLRRLEIENREHQENYDQCVQKAEDLFHQCEESRGARNIAYEAEYQACIARRETSVVYCLAAFELFTRSD